MDIGTREGYMRRDCQEPNSAWTTQFARNVCDMRDGFLLEKRFLIYDRSALFNKRFDIVFKSIGLEIKELPPLTPMMNSRLENFIRAIKTEYLDKIIFTNEAQLRLAVKEYLKYWNHYRAHAGLGGRMVQTYPQDSDGEFIEISFLGGLIHGYRRNCQAA